MMYIWLWSSIFPMLACGESDEVSTPTLSEVTSIEEAKIEKEIHQDGLTVRTTVTPISVRLGDPFYLELSVEGNLGTEIEMPPFGEALGRLTIVNFTPKQKTLNESETSHQVHTQKYTLQPNRSGEVVIPALRVGYRVSSDADWEEVLTEPFPIEVLSILPTDGDLVYQTLRNRLDPLPIDRPWVPWVLGAGGSAALLGLGIWLVGRRTGAEVQVSAYQQAVLLLNQIQDEISTLTETSLVDELYAQLSVVVRGYLEGCFQVPALEQTTEELRQSLMIDLNPYEDVVSEQQVVEILQLLSVCDAVKFAGQIRSTSEVQSDWDTAHHIVTIIHERLANSPNNVSTEGGTDGLV